MRFLPVKASMLLGLSVSLLLAGCSKSQDVTVTLSGSSTIAPLAQELGRQFEAAHPGIRVDVQSGGSSRGISDARSGLVQIGMVSRALKPDERDLMAFPIAQDGIAIILNESNPVSQLSDAQIIDIYTDKINNWSQVGGADVPVTVVNKAEGRSTLELFLHYFKLKNADIQADVVIGENQQAIKTVSGSPNAIAYVSIGTAEYEAGHGEPIKLLPMAGVEASTSMVAQGHFPLSRPLNLVVKTMPEGSVKDFIDFARSPDAVKVIQAQYFVPLSEGQTP